MTSAEKAQMLLPWYVNGNISYDDEKLVESELAKSSGLRKEFELQRSIAKRVKQDTDILDIGVISTQEQRLTQMMGRIRNDALSEESARNTGASFFKCFPKVLSSLAPVFSRQWVYPTFAFLILVQLGVLIYIVKPDVLSTYTSPNMFEQAAKDDIAPSQRAEVLIEFTPQAKQSEIEALLAKVNAEIVYHPEGSYSYRVVLNGVTDEDHVNQILSNLQSHRQLVLFADRGY